MKKFFLDYGYSSVKMFVDQFAIALFGVSLVIAVSGLDNEYSNTLVYVVSGFAVLFYLVLIYSIPWNHGAKDRISVDYNKKERNLLLGLYLGLVANIPNFLIAALAGIFSLTGVISLAEACRMIGVWLEGMYLGLLQFKVGDAALNAYWWMLFLVTLPAILTSTLAYIAGYYNVRVFKFKEKKKYY